MMKPETYGETCVIVRNLPYECEDDRRGPSTAGGVLGKGSVVWVERRDGNRNGSVSSSRTGSVTAYVEGIGVVSVDPRYLAPLS